MLNTAPPKKNRLVLDLFILGDHMGGIICSLFQSVPDDVPINDST